MDKQCNTKIGARVSAAACEAAAMFWALWVVEMADSVPKLSTEMFPALCQQLAAIGLVVFYLWRTC